MNKVLAAAENRLLLKNKIAKDNLAIFICALERNPSSRNAGLLEPSPPQSGGSLEPSGSNTRFARCLRHGKTPVFPTLFPGSIPKAQNNKNRNKFGFYYLCPREESNPYHEIRNLASYPLNDEGRKLFISKIQFFCRDGRLEIPDIPFPAVFLSKIFLFPEYLC